MHICHSKEREREREREKVVPLGYLCTLWVLSYPLGTFQSAKGYKGVLLGYFREPAWIKALRGKGTQSTQGTQGWGTLEKGTFQQLSARIPLGTFKEFSL